MKTIKNIIVAENKSIYNLLNQSRFLDVISSIFEIDYSNMYRNNNSNNNENINNTNKELIIEDILLGNLKPFTRFSTIST